MTKFHTIVEEEEEEEANAIEADAAGRHKVNNEAPRCQ